MKTVTENYTLNPKKFGAKLKELREEKGYTQQDIADKLGLKSANSISNYESGKCFPRKERLYSLSRIYCTSVDYLIGRDENKKDAYKNEVVEITTVSDSKFGGEDVVLSADLTEQQIKILTAIIDQYMHRDKAVSNADTIGGRLKKLRIMNDASQTETAEMVGISNSTICNLESGKTNPTMDNLIALAKLYGVSTDYILGLEKEKTSCDTTGLTFQQKKLVSDLIDSLKESNREGAIFSTVIFGA